MLVAADDDADDDDDVCVDRMKGVGTGGQEEERGLLCIG